MAATSFAPQRRVTSSPRLQATPQLKIVKAPSRRLSTKWFLTLCTLTVIATVGSALFINVLLSQGSYEISRLQNESRALSAEQAALVRKGEELSTPQELAKRAAAIGMVPAASSAYIDLSTGTVIGEAQPAAKTDQPAPKIPVAAIYDHGPEYFGLGSPTH